MDLCNRDNTTYLMTEKNNRLLIGSEKHQHQQHQQNNNVVVAMPAPSLSISSNNKPSQMSLGELIEQLYKAFEGSEVDRDYVQDLMATYRSNPQDWKKYSKFDRYRYTRNLVDEGNGKFNLLVLCWGEGHGSAIHDHANAHCFMKILQGELCETQYNWPPENTHEDGSESQNGLEEINKCTYRTNDVAYINDSIGLHRVENLSTVSPAVSLHLYSPPFSSCSVFNKQSGQRSKSTVTFWSKYGKRRCNDIQDSRTPEDN